MNTSNRLIMLALALLLVAVPVLHGQDVSVKNVEVTVKETAT
jgi:hypothetical protein